MNMSVKIYYVYFKGFEGYENIVNQTHWELCLFKSLYDVS